MFSKVVAVSLLALASSQLMAAECKTTVDSTDQMSFNTKEITIDKSCKTFTVELTHSGNLPKNVMGHNLVISKEADMQPIATDGLAAGIDKNSTLATYQDSCTAQGILGQVTTDIKGETSLPLTYPSHH